MIRWRVGVESEVRENRFRTAYRCCQQLSVGSVRIIVVAVVALCVLREGGGKSSDSFGDGVRRERTKEE